MFQFFNRFRKPSVDYKTLLQKGAVVVDVRTFDEFKSGHIIGSKNIGLNDIRVYADQIKSWNQPIITVCRSGNRSAIAKSILEKEGIEVHNGGSWKIFNEKHYNN